MNNQFFDLHLHPSTKPFLTGIDVPSRVSCWKTIELRLLFNLDEHATIGGDRLDSQCGLAQMWKGKIRLAILPLHALERDFAKADFFERIIYGINPNRSNAAPDSNLIDAIGGGDNDFSPFQLINEELELLARDLKPPGAWNMQGELTFLEKVPDAPLGDDKIHAFFSVEGGHCFLQSEAVDTFPHQDAAAIGAVINRLELLDDKIRNAHRSKLIFVTLTHIGRSPMCTQAFAFALRKEHKIAEGFMPRDVAGSGAIRPVGWRFIEKCLQRNICIDIKHMSYRARCEYYQYLKSHHLDVPIIASHFGAVGMSFEKFRTFLDQEHGQLNSTPRKKIDRQPGYSNTRFYSISLNLFDEEIRLIVESGGLIGISLDERILGQKTVRRRDTTNATFEHDYFTQNDLEWLAGNGYDQFQNTLPPLQTLDAPPFSAKIPKSIDFLCNTILRFVYAGGINSWKHLAIGSDFDGLIDAIDSCETAAILPLLRENIKAPLITMIESVPGAAQKFHVNTLDLANDLEQKLDDIFFYNGYEFLKKHVG